MRPAHALVVVASLGLVGGCIRRNPDFVGQTGGTKGDSADTNPATSAADTSADTTGAADTGTPDGTDTIDSADTSAATTTGSPTGSTGAQACTGDLESIRETIFAVKCSDDTCHSGDTPAANLDLTTADEYVDLLDISSTTCAGWTRVVASSPESSMLYARVSGIVTCMPVEFVEHEVLPADEQACLADWINSIEACERCGGMQCIDLQTDSLHCGTCDNSCPAGVSCTDGVCACPGGETACRGECFDLQTSMAHCGDCSNDCGAAVCTTGMCDCLPTELNCGSCVDPNTNNDHCGGCNQPCGIGETCQMGMCACSDVAKHLGADVQPIFTANCTASNCHDAVGPKMGMDLTDGATYGHTVNVATMQCGGSMTRVIPGNPIDSYIMHKLTGVDICAGVQMPNGAGQLGDGDLDTIAAWICQGAMDD